MPVLLRGARLALGACLCASLLAACSGDDDGGEGDKLPEGCDVLVEKSDDDQGAVQLALIEASEGQTVCLGEGTFSFVQQLTVGTNQITIKGMGMEATVLDFAAQDVGANGILITGDGVTVEDLQVRDSPGDGIRANEVEGITFRRVRVAWQAASSMENGAYGLYPVGCTNVLIEECVVHGARDAGVYVGQSVNIIVRNNEAYGNVAGIEIENSLDADVYDNHAHDNTAGLLVFDLPDLDLFGGRAKVHNNLIEENNLENFAQEGNIVAVVPPGTGMFILSSDNNEVHDNTIQNNHSVGLALVSYQELLTGSTPDDPNFDLYPQGNWVHDNTFSGNGGDPAALVLAANAGQKPVPDMIWDGCEDEAADNSDGSLTNCFSNNGDATYLNFNLCGGDNSTDLAPVTCEYSSLPRVELP